jgi:uncharacterized protein (DUF486 family)
VKVPTGVFLIHLNDLLKPAFPMLDRFYPALLLLGSNLFMTFAWYGHLRYKSAPLALAILASWGIALFEYCLMVPANRFGSTMYSARSSRACRR